MGYSGGLRAHPLLALFWYEMWKRKTGMLEFGVCFLRFDPVMGFGTVSWPASRRRFFLQILMVQGLEMPIRFAFDYCTNMNYDESVIPRSDRCVILTTYATGVLRAGVWNHLDAFSMVTRHKRSAY